VFPIKPKSIPYFQPAGKAVRFFKVVLPIILIWVICLTILIFYRLPLSNFVANKYLNQYDGKITCLEINFGSAITLDLTELISKLCIQSPQAKVELTDIAIQWQFTFNRFSTESRITALSVDQLNIIRTNSFFDSNDKKEVFSFEEMQQSLSQMIPLILPAITAQKIKVNKINYQTYNAPPTLAQTRYLGAFSASQSKIFFSINKAEHTAFLKVEISPLAKKLTAELDLDLLPLREFLSQHQLKLPASFNSSLVIEGKLNSQLEWLKQNNSTANKSKLTLNSQLSNLVIDSSIEDLLIKNKQMIPFKLNGSLAWRTSFSENNIGNFDFSNESNKKSEINISYKNESLLKLLSTNDVAKPLLKLIKENEHDGISIKPHGLLKVDLENRAITLSSIDLTAQQTRQSKSVNKLVLTDIQLTQNKLSNAIDLLKGKFSLIGQLHTTELNKLNDEPLSINAIGEVSKTQQGWNIKLEPTTVELSKIHLSKLQINPDEGKVTTKSSPRLEQLITSWQGEINLSKDIDQPMTFSLLMDSQLYQLNMPSLLQIAQGSITAKINGSAHNLSIVGNVEAEQLEFAKFSFSGDIKQPEINIYANQLSLSELLALKINLPFSVKPMDGQLSYQVSGQIFQPESRNNNSLNLSVALKGMSGVFNDIWMQNINWQHNFTLSDGNIESAATIQNTAIHPFSNNKLTIDLIETAPNFTNLSADLNIGLTNNTFNLNANNIKAELLGGNINIAQVQWPLVAEHSVDVQLNEIDLEKLLELDKKQGIVVTGKVSGTLPIFFKNKKLTIENGDLYNVSNGVIQVKDNPAVERLKVSSTELKLAFDALQNLHYHQLSADVAMADDGYMLLDTKIKGRNPDIDNDVNLNLNINYDLLGLLESMKITEKYEQSIINDLHKPKEQP